MIMKTMSHATCEILLDGSSGEGGGQILRSALSLSAITGRSFRLEKIRAGRKRPGLMRQHLTCVRATASICGARTSALELGCGALSFWPGEISDSYEVFPIGTAGSTSLLLQTVLPILVHGESESEVVFEGGTHVAFAPCFDYVHEVYLPQLRRMGAEVEIALQRHGFFPAGAGRVSLAVGATGGFEPYHGPESKEGEIELSARVLSTPHIAPSVAEREFEAVRAAFGISADNCSSEIVHDAACAGNVLVLRANGGNATTLCCSLGERGKPARHVAGNAIKAMRRYLGSQAPVDEYLADQLLLPLALAGGGGFTATRLTPHFHSNVEVIEAFLPVKICSEEVDRYAHRVTIGTV